MISTAEKATVSYDLRGKRVWIAGHTGMVGSALLRRLKRERCDIQTVAHGEVDLTRQVGGQGVLNVLVQDREPNRESVECSQ